MKPTDDESVFYIAWSFLWLSRKHEELTTDLISKKVDIVLQMDRRWKSCIDREALIRKLERIVSFWRKELAAEIDQK
jgi:hypothetical protein